jgi:hypothetical protein
MILEPPAAPPTMLVEEEFYVLAGPVPLRRENRVIAERKSKMEHEQRTYASCSSLRRRISS